MSLSRFPIVLVLAVVGVLASSSTPVMAAGPQTPVTRAASDVAGTSATVNGELNPTMSGTAGYEFTYNTNGTCTEGATTTPGPELTGRGIEVSTPLTGLEGNTEYTFCVVAMHLEGETTEATSGSALSFKTLAVAPEVIAGTESASGVTPYEATLAAQVNPENQAATYSVEYSTEANGEALEGSITTISGGSLPATGGAEQIASIATGDRLVPNTTYHYRLIATNSTGRAVGPLQEFTTLLPPPAVSTGGPVEIGRTDAQVTGAVNAEGLPTTYEYQYGTSTSYEQSTAATSAGAEDGDLPAPASLTDLTPSTTYHYRLLATNDDGTTYGADHTLTTLPPTPPDATTAGASAIGQNSATISGTIAANGLQTRFGFEIGIEAGDYGPVTGLGSMGGTGTQFVSSSVGGLQPATTYHYRVFATNSDGTSYGADQTFTTPGFPPGVTPPAPAPVVGTPVIVFPHESAVTKTTTPRALTSAQKLAAALKACERKPKRQRSSCRRQARQKYPTAIVKHGKRATPRKKQGRR